MAAIQSAWIGQADYVDSGDYIETGAIPEPTWLKEYSNSPTVKVWNSGAVQILRWVATGAQVYHGYRRNGDSIGWAIGWFFVPTLIGVPLMLAQGFGKRSG